jgi:hypothetical protein
MNDRVFQLFLMLVSAVVGAIGASIPGMLRSWRSDVKAEGVSANVIATLQTSLGRIDQRLDDVTVDIDGVAKANRELYDRLEKRLDKAEKKGVALEGAVTGKMPRISGEGPTNG